MIDIDTIRFLNKFRMNCSSALTKVLSSYICFTPFSLLKNILILAIFWIFFLKTGIKTYNTYKFALEHLQKGGEILTF